MLTCGESVDTLRTTCVRYEDNPRTTAQTIPFRSGQIFGFTVTGISVFSNINFQTAGLVKASHSPSHKNELFLKSFAFRNVQFICFYYSNPASNFAFCFTHDLGLRWFYIFIYSVLSETLHYRRCFLFETKSCPNICSRKKVVPFNFPKKCNFCHKTHDFRVIYANERVQVCTWC